MTRTFQQFHVGVGEPRDVLLEQIHLRKGVPGALDEQQRDVDIREVIDPELLGLAGRVQRVRVEDDAVRLVSFGHEKGGHPPAHGAACQEEPVHSGTEVVSRSTMALDQLLGPVGTFGASLGVRVVEGEDVEPGIGKVFPQQSHHRVVLVGARAVGQEDASPSRSGETTRHFAFAPWDCYFSGHCRESRAPRYRLGMELVIHETPEATAASAAERVAGLVARSKGPFTLGFAGGSTPRATYQAMRGRVGGWERVEGWLSDERWVPHDHSRSNGLMVAETLTDHVPASLHRPPWSELLEPEDSAAHYEAKIRSLHPDGRPDLILLGMGDDGHTASLFPGTAALSERERWYVANHVPGQPDERLTATYPLLWSARMVIVLVVGENKAAALKSSFERKTPAGLIGDGDSTVEWHVDTAAASLLS